MDFDWTTLVNGGAGAAVLYLAAKIDTLTKLLRGLQADVTHLKDRVTRLESRPRPRKRR